MMLAIIRAALVTTLSKLSSCKSLRMVEAAGSGEYGVYRFLNGNPKTWKVPGGAAGATLLRVVAKGRPALC
jgi:hypothetical protein